MQKARQAAKSGEQSRTWQKLSVSRRKAGAAAPQADQAPAHEQRRRAPAGTSRSRFGAKPPRAAAA